MMENIKTIVFDFFGVCVNNFPEQTGKALLEKFSISQDAWNAFVGNAAEGLDVGKKEESAFVEDIVHFFHLSCSPEDLEKDLIRWDNQFLKVNDALIDVIKKLKENRTIVCFSNVSEALSKRMAGKGLYDIFDETFFSYQIGKTKKEGEAWDYLEQKLNILPQESLFIDDSERNVQVAQSRGWHAQLYKSDGNIEEELRRML